MRTHPIGEATEPPDESTLAALTRLTSASLEIMERDYQARIEALEARALRYETMIESIPQGVCLFDAEERLQQCNRRYAQIYRLAPEQVRPGTTLREIAERRVAAGTGSMAADDYMALATLINSNAASKIWLAELKDRRTIQICHLPVLGGGWMSTHEDITEFMSNRGLDNERISLQTLIDWIPDCLWVKDLESRFVIANKTVASLWGRTRTSDMIGLTDADFFSPQVARDIRAVEHEIMRTGQPIIETEELNIHSSGIRKWHSSTKVALRNDRNEVTGLVGITRDVTARKLADLLRDGQAQILEMIAMSAPLEEVLVHLVHLIESQLTGIFGSVLLLDESGTHLWHAAAPSLAQT